MTTTTHRATRPRSYRELLAHTVRTHPDKPALRTRSDSDAAQPWSTLSWKQVGKLVIQASLWLGTNDVKRISIVSRASIGAWILEAGALVAGVDINPIYEDALADEQSAALDTVAPDLIAVDGVDSLLALAVLKPGIKTANIDELLTTWSTAVQAGPMQSSEIAAIIGAWSDNDPAVLLQSTGTTGPPTVIELGDSSMIAATWSLRNEVEISHPRFLAFLPAAHTSHLLINFYAATLFAADIWIGGGVETIVEDLDDVKPNVMFGAPLLFDSIRDEFVDEISGSAIGRFLLMRVQRRAAKILDEGVISHSSASMLGRLLGRFVAKSAGLGNAKDMFSGTSPLSPETHAFFAAIGWYVRNTYGLTECGGAATVSGRKTMAVGELGQLVEGLELRLDSDGQILLRGEANMRGKLGRERVGPDSWLATGDLGESIGSTYRFVGRASDVVHRDSVVTTLTELDGLATGALGRGQCTVGRLEGNEIALVVSAEQDGTRPASIAEIVETLRGQSGALELVDTIAVIDEPLARSRGELGATGKVRRWKIMERVASTRRVSVSARQSGSRSSAVVVRRNDFGRPDRQ